MNNNSLAEIAKQLNNIKTCAIFCHIRPDGDALGSGLALYTALKNAGKEAYMVCEDEVPARLKLFPAFDEVIQSLPFERDKFDTLIAVDSADIARIGNFSSVFSRFKGVTINIDHHISNDRYAKYNYVLDSTATCEIMPEVLSATGLEITKDIANLLAVGLLTDSGNFAHQDVTQKTFEVAANLRQCGADFSIINYQLFSRQTKNRAILYGRVMNKMRFALDDKLAIITITQRDFKETDTEKSQTEGFVDFPLSIDGVEVAVAIMEAGKCQYKASLRSKRVNVNAVAAQFGGGGHILASGCMLYGEYEEVVEKLTYAIYQNL